MHGPAPIFASNAIMPHLYNRGHEDDVLRWVLPPGSPPLPVCAASRADRLDQALVAEAGEGLVDV